MKRLENGITNYVSRLIDSPDWRVKDRRVRAIAEMRAWRAAAARAVRNAGEHDAMFGDVAGRFSRLTPSHGAAGP